MSKMTVRNALLLGATFITVGVVAEGSAKAAVYDNQAPQARKVGFYKPERNNAAAQSNAAASSFDSLRHNVLMATTQMVGEEEGQRPPIAVTEAVGEDGRPPISATMAIGEDGRPPDGHATTMMVGEEDVKPPVVDPKPPVPPSDPGHVTTMMVGEEDVKPPVVNPKPPVHPPVDPGHVTTMMVGEEDVKPQPPVEPPVGRPVRPKPPIDPFHPDDRGFHPKDPRDNPGHPDDRGFRPKDDLGDMPDRPDDTGMRPKDDKDKDKDDKKDKDKNKHGHYEYNWDHKTTEWIPDPGYVGTGPKDTKKIGEDDDKDKKDKDKPKHPDDSGFHPKEPRGFHPDDSGMRPVDRLDHPDDSGMRPVDRADDSGWPTTTMPIVTGKPVEVPRKPRTGGDSSKPSPYEHPDTPTQLPKTNNDATGTNGKIPQTIWSDKIRGKDPLANPTNTIEKTNTND